jgi:hypothetical protein
MIEALVIVVAVLVVLGVIAAGLSVRVVQQFEQGIVFRFAGRGFEPHPPNRSCSE